MDQKDVFFREVQHFRQIWIWIQDIAQIPKTGGVSFGNRKSKKEYT
jgi:hypothetical protein